MTTFEKIRKAALARLEAGEPAHIILQDYADFEDELHPILERASGGRGVTASSKAKVKRQTSVSTVPIIALGGVVLLVIFGVLGFLSFNIVSDDGVVIANPLTVSSCIGIPAAQITSAYAQQNQNTMRNDDGSGRSSITSSSSRSLSAPEMEVLESVDMADDDISAEMPPAMGEPSADGMDMEDSSMMVMSTAQPTLNSASPQTDPLRAGEIDDNAEWDEYQAYRNRFLNDYGTAAVRDVDTTDRQVIRVVDADGQPIANACVEIYHGDTHITSALTYATGMTMFFPNLNDNTRYVDNFRVVVSKADERIESELNREVVGGVTTLTLPINQQIDRVQLDIMFLLDATGSMGDEIAQLQENILNISDEINALSDTVDVRYGLVSYRDRTDQYVTRVHDFTDDINVFQADLMAVRASGGGDYPESMNQGLDMALNAVQWRADDTIRLTFLVADAPPHVDYADDADYSLLMQDALARGIKIHQLASSGLQPEGEFVMRQIAQFTMGRFLFLTYDEGVAGTPGDERPDLEVGTPEDEQGIGDYSVSQLDELVLRLIVDEVNLLLDQ
ncbi:MAG: vWA domain-containing protein [Anaerolineae bacterium]